MKATDVFTPGRFPTRTYVEDHLVDRKRRLLDTLDAGSMLISISGPSKSGKTVFVEQTLGKDNLVQITGAGTRTAAA
jgi:predicted AAA+ superfamily ATPase